MPPRTRPLSTGASASPRRLLQRTTRTCSPLHRYLQVCGGAPRLRMATSRNCFADAAYMFAASAALSGAACLSSSVHGTGTPHGALFNPNLQLAAQTSRRACMRPTPVRLERVPDRFRSASPPCDMPHTHPPPPPVYITTQGQPCRGQEAPAWPPCLNCAQDLELFRVENFSTPATG